MDPKDLEFLKNRKKTTLSISESNDLPQTLHGKDKGEIKRQMSRLVDDLIETIQSNQKETNTRKHLQGVIDDE